MDFIRALLGTSWGASIDAAVLWLLSPLALAILISGLDDLSVDLTWAWFWIKKKIQRAPSLYPPGPRQLESAPIKSIAIFLPLWQEDAVIERMLEHNLGSIRYEDYHILAGCYPNDPATQEAVQRVARRFPRVHMVVCPNPGPTSKADCLNSIYEELERIELRTGIRFDVILTHDAEDMIHPEELRWINYYAARYDFVQTPVLPLPTPIHEVTHGIYCDEFAEYHTRDMVVRAETGCFVPSCGVGTGYRREALDKLAAESRARGEEQIFARDALTEDYENGLQLRRLGFSQAFIPIAPYGSGDFVATREYFPRRFTAAIRQRTRWTMGIALQSWQRYGWRRDDGNSWLETYWLWRDRKGLLANPVSCLANFVFFYGLATGVWDRATPLALQLSIATLVLLVLRTSVRIVCVSRIYGLLFALGAPIRAICANVLNTGSTVRAVFSFTLARIKNRPLAWLKTDHAYPGRDTLLAHKRRLGEILVSLGRLAEPELPLALAACPTGVRLGEFLVDSGRLPVETLYEALAFQQGLPVAHIETTQITVQVKQSLPRHVLRRWRLIPFGITDDGLQLASPDIPSETMLAEIAKHTSLVPQLHLITPAEYQQLAKILH